VDYFRFRGTAAKFGIWTGAVNGSPRTPTSACLIGWTFCAESNDDQVQYQRSNS
jgi:hypothetical protein